MNKLFGRIINNFAEKPRKLFLADSIGAFLTAFFLLLIRIKFNAFVGMPPGILTFLSLIAASFFFYSISCFFFLKNNWSPFIRIISIANLFYCALTMALVVIHFPKLTTPGIVYFSGEILIVCGLVYIELKVANNIHGI